MQSGLLTRLAWQAKRLVLRLGVTCWAAICLFVLSGAFYYLEVLPQQEMLGELQLSMRKQPRIQQTEQSGSHYAVSPRDQVEHFYQILFEERHGPDLLGSIFKTAKEFDLSLDKGDYVLVRDSSNKIARYEIALPLRGSYIQVRRFLAKILASTPGLALNSISFQRQKVGDATIEAQVKLTLFLAGEQ